MTSKTWHFQHEGKQGHFGHIVHSTYQAHKKRYLMSLKCPEAPKKSKFLLIISIRTTIYTCVIRARGYRQGEVGRESWTILKFFKSAKWENFFIQSHSPKQLTILSSYLVHLPNYYHSLKNSWPNSLSCLQLLCNSIEIICVAYHAFL